MTNLEKIRNEDGSINVNEYNRIAEKASIQNSIKSPKIRSYYHYNRNKTLALVAYIIEVNVELIGFRNPPSTAQIKDMAYHYVRNYDSDTFHDLIVFFNKLRSGALGDTRYLTIFNVLEFNRFFQVYLDLKAQELENMYHNQKKNFYLEVNSELGDEIRKLRETLKREKAQEDSKEDV